MAKIKLKDRIIIIWAVCCLMTTTAIVAQTNQTLRQRIDSMAVHKYDASFIEVPERPWRIILRTRMNETDIDFVNLNSFDNGGSATDTRMALNFDSKLGTSAGIWVGYRGLGIGYSYKLQKNAGSNFYISGTGAKFGINLRIRALNIDDFHMDFDYKENNKPKSLEADAKFLSPIRANSVYLNTYYVFNGRRYSQAAAYNQAVIQQKSAGSLLIGGTGFASFIDMAKPENASIIALADSLGYIALAQISIGVGYGYNWVPARGWTLNAMVMPNISLLDNVIRTKYDCNYDFFSKGTVDDYGEWDSENRLWANGKTRKPSSIGGKDVEWQNDVDIWTLSTDTHKSSMTFNVDVRLGIAYCWNRYFVSANAIFNRFSYGHQQNRVILFDWYTNFSLGIRL